LGEKTTHIDTAKAAKPKGITPHRYHCTTVARSVNRLQTISEFPDVGGKEIWYN
jgi:hypothetical protein